MIYFKIDGDKTFGFRIRELKYWYKVFFSNPFGLLFLFVIKELKKCSNKKIHLSLEVFFLRDKYSF